MMLSRTGWGETFLPVAFQTVEGRRAPWGCAAGAPYRRTASPPPPPHQSASVCIDVHHCALVCMAVHHCASLCIHVHQSTPHGRPGAGDLTVVWW